MTFQEWMTKDLWKEVCSGHCSIWWHSTVIITAKDWAKCALGSLISQITVLNHFCKLRVKLLEPYPHRSYFTWCCQTCWVFTLGYLLPIPATPGGLLHANIAYWWNGRKPMENQGGHSGIQRPSRPRHGSVLVWAPLNYGKPKIGQSKMEMIFDST